MLRRGLAVREINVFELDQISSGIDTIYNSQSDILSLLAGDTLELTYIYTTGGVITFSLGFSWGMIRVQ